METHFGLEFSGMSLGKCPRNLSLKCPVKYLSSARVSNISPVEQGVAAILFAVSHFRDLARRNKKQCSDENNVNSIW